MEPCLPNYKTLRKIMSIDWSNGKKIILNGTKCGVQINNFYLRPE
jgi:hypothetical protein